MIAVGIDVSKGKSTVAILDGDGSIRAHPYEMNHSKAELDALIKYIKAVDDHPIILMEPTSHYHYPILKAFIEAVTESLAKGDAVQLVGFGTFDVGTRGERTGRNPKTGESIKIKASKCPKFKAGKALKDSVNK